MKCLSCGFENEIDAAYCIECGSALVGKCPKCGSQVKAGDKFCKKCGTRLSNPPAPADESRQPSPTRQPSASLLGEKPGLAGAERMGERKPVTILFTDIVDSTSIAEKLDPEEWKDIVNGVHHLVTQVISRYEGTIAQLLGDGVLAYFGAPATHEDDPLRAVRAALDIQSEVSVYRRQLAGLIDDFQIRIGIHTGTVVVGHVGDDLHTEYLAVGDAVNLAARLQAAARPGGVLVSEVVARQVGAAFELQSLGEIHVKGKAEPVNVFQLLKEKAAPENFRGFEELHSPLVGREHELGLLREALNALASGQGQIVNILGEPGIGKSRLTEEACQIARGSAVKMNWLEGRALSYGQSLSFWTITQLLFSDLSLSSGDPEIRIRAALKRRLTELFGEKSSEILPYLFHLIGVGLEGEQAERIKSLDSETLKHQILVAITRYFERLAQNKPTVAVFEDLHWADPSSLEALKQLLVLTDRVPLALILVSRTERELPSWQIKVTAETDFPHRYTEIQLKPLTGEEQNQLVDNLLALADLPETVQRQILSRAEGNPFFLEEIIRALIEQGALLYAGGSWRASENIQNIRIPATLEGVLLARIDRLQEGIRHTLQLAAVIGRSFLYRLLALITETESALDQHLVQLQRVDLIRERTRLPELEYIFKHSLTQEAAYNSLLLEQRHAYHRRVGEALEDLFADRLEQFWGLLAYHFEAGGEAEKAIQYLILAGDQAKFTDEHSEAIDYYRRAIKLLAGGKQESRAAQAWLKLALIYHANFQFEASHQAYETAFQLQRNFHPERPNRINRQSAVLRASTDGPFHPIDPGKVIWLEDVNVARSLFSGLARISSEVDVLPEVARSWQVLDGGRRYLFHLRDDFHWSDGAPVTATDFEWAWKRNLNPETRADSASLLFDILGARDYHLGIDPQPEHVGVHALDVNTLEVLLIKPVAYFPFIVTLPVTFPLPRAAIERFGEDWWLPGRIVTNGPFRLAALDLQRNCRLERSLDYPIHADGNISRIDWNVLEDRQDSLQAYLENRIDYTEMPATLLPAGFPKNEIFTEKNLFVLQLNFDPLTPPLNDPRVRKALAYSIGRQKIEEWRHLPVARGGLIPPGMPGHSPDIGLPDDVELGRKLLAEAGFPDGRGFPSLSGVTLQGLIPFGEACARHWREHLGVEVNFQALDLLNFYEWREKHKDTAVFIHGWIGDYPDPDDFMRQSDTVAMMNFLGWRDPDFDQLLDRAASTSDRGKRMAMYRQADYMLVHEQALVIPLDYRRGAIKLLVKPWVKNFILNSLSGLDYRNIILEER